MNQNERGSILRHFIMAGDSSRYGLINAVTRASQDIEDYSRATELERLGGELLSVSSVKNQPIVIDGIMTDRPMKNITHELALVR